MQAKVNSMKSILLTATLAVSLLLTVAAPAHHSAAAVFDLDLEIEVQGTVTRFTLGNPHARIFMLVTDAAGDEVQWMAEGGSRTVLLRTGWTNDDIQPGDVVKVIGNPSRDGSPVVHWERVILPDGNERWGEDIPADDVLEQIRDRRR
jgi:hypothetical protein